MNIQQTMYIITLLSLINIQCMENQIAQKNEFALVNDIIEPGNNWEEEKDISKNKLNFLGFLTPFVRAPLTSPKNAYIRKIERYVPSNLKDRQINDKDLLIAIVTHGTWGSETATFYKSQDDTDQNYRHFKRFVSWYAYINQKAAKILSYEWNGALSEDSRITSAQVLNDYISKEYPQIPLILIAHSHGCNVHNHFSQLTQNPIELMIHLACPNRHGQPEYKPLNFKQLFYFHSEADMIERLGRIKESKFSGSIIHLGKSAAKTFGGVFAAGTVAKLACDSDEQIQKYALHAASMVIVKKMVDSSCPNLEEFINVFTRDLRHAFTNDNYFKPQDNTIIVGLKTTINGKKLGHSYVPDVAQLLPEIFTKIYREYPAHTAHSFVAELDLNTVDLSPVKIKNIGVNNMIKLDHYPTPICLHFLPTLSPYVGLSTSHISNRKKLVEVKSLNGQIKSPFVSARDRLDCAAKMIYTETNNFTFEDLDKEVQKNIAENHGCKIFYASDRQTEEMNAESRSPHDIYLPKIEASYDSDTEIGTKH